MVDINLNQLSTKDCIDIAATAKESGSVASVMALSAFEHLSEKFNVGESKSEIVGLLIYLINEYVIPRAKQVVENQINMQIPIVVNADTFELKIETKQ